MSHTPQAARPARELVEALIGKAIFCFGVARHHARRARTRKILRSLSEEQLRDVGIDRSSIDNGPEEKVDARLKSDLMSLR